MSFSIRSALDALIAVQAALTIASPTSLSILRAYKTFPNQEGVLPDTPAFINIPRLLRVSHIAGARAQTWQVRSQLLIVEADQDRAGDIVLAFVEKYLDALSAAVTLHGLPLILTDITSGDLGSFVYGGRSFPGIEITVPYKVPLEAVTVAA